MSCLYVSSDDNNENNQGVIHPELWCKNVSLENLLNYICTYKINKEINGLNNK